MDYLGSSMKAAGVDTAHHDINERLLDEVRPAAVTKGALAERTSRKSLPGAEVYDFIRISR